MQLYLMQHGLCLPGELNPEQPLSPIGREQIEKSARGMARLQIKPDLILASPKTRSRETAQIVAAATGCRERDIVVSEQVKAMAAPEAALELLAQFATRQQAFIAGHLPSLREIAARLITKGQRAALHMENGGLMRIDVESFDPPAGTLVWSLAPMHLHVIAAG